MATINTALRNSIIADVVSNLDRLDILDGAAVLTTFIITWAAGAAGVQEVQSTPVASTAGGSGDADLANLYNNAASPDEQITGLTVGVGAEQVVIDNVTIASGQTVNLTAMSLTMPATV